MFCPLCGSRMEVIERKTEELDVVRIGFEDGNTNGSAVWWRCTNADFPCFGDDFPLIEHHPERGLESAPGDSWSLTWLK